MGKMIDIIILDIVLLLFSFLFGPAAGLTVLLMEIFYTLGYYVQMKK